MAPGLPRMVPGLCSEENTPNITAWFDRMAERDAVKQLSDYFPRRD